MPVLRPELSLPLTTSLLETAVASRACPAVVVEVGRMDAPLWSHAVGTLSYEPDAPAATGETIFDLASLTKVVATASLAMRHVHAGRLDLDRGLGDYLSGWAGGERSGITIRRLLDHSSGLPAHARFWEQAAGRDGYEQALRALPLEAAPGTRAVYSDVGFILAGFVLEDVAGESLPSQMARLGRELALGPLTYLPPPDWRHRTAPTEFDPWRSRMLVGEVHDENAAALGGAAGHAGLFGTAPAVGRFARALLAALAGRCPQSDILPRAADFVRRTGVPGSSRALGWDTMLPTSSCGSRLSPGAIGHTGFTGTSLWIDPHRDLYVVLLSNRVHPTRANEAFPRLRPRIHEAIVEDLEQAGVLSPSG